MYYFTADNHFNHGNIITYCGRPFRDAEHMDSVMIARWNGAVCDHDTVFVLGDFKFGGGSENLHEIRSKLHGKIIFVVGNHDKNNGVNAIIFEMVIKLYGRRILLVHNPMDAYERAANFDFVFSGHVHEKWRFRRNIVNVGVDVWNFIPVTVPQIIKTWNKWNHYCMINSFIPTYP